MVDLGLMGVIRGWDLEVEGVVMSVEDAIGD